MCLGKKCNIFGRAKKHRCFLEKQLASSSVEEGSEAFVEILIPVLISKKCLKYINGEGESTPPETDDRQKFFPKSMIEPENRPVPSVDAAFDYIIKNVKGSCFGCVIEDENFEHSCKDNVAAELVKDYFEKLCEDLNYQFCSEFERTLFQTGLEEKLSSSPFTFL